ncbi:MAG: hypothetical protein ACPHID_01165 [Thermoplasmatota archaeon]
MRILLAALVSLLLAPLAAAHGAPVVLDVEDHLIADEASDASYLWDGFDITNVYVREAFYKAADQEGLIFRVMASGTSIVAGEHVLQLESEQTGLIDFVSNDGLSWESSHELVEVGTQTDGATGAVNVNLQVFVPFDLDGILGPVTARAYADGAQVDEAPGPIYIQDQPIAAFGEGTRVIDELALDGPDGYTTSDISYLDGLLTVQVGNEITVTGQHIFVLSSVVPSSISYTIGDETTEGSAADVGAGEEPVFTAKVDASAPFQVRIQSDLGGQETYWVSPSGTVTEFEPAGTEAEPLSQESPGPGAILVLGLIGLALLRRQSL